MTLFTIQHLDGTKSTRQSDKDLRWAVVVYTPKGTRSRIQQALADVLEVSMDNMHRGLADGTVSYRDGRTYVGGLKAPDREAMLQVWSEALEWRNSLDMELPDLYQATHWFSNLADALNAGNRLQDEYDATPWRRTVYVKPVSEAA
jgi:hypothetical protein